MPIDLHVLLRTQESRVMGVSVRYSGFLRAQEHGCGGVVDRTEPLRLRDAD